MAEYEVKKTEKTFDLNSMIRNMDKVDPYSETPVEEQMEKLKQAVLGEEESLSEESKKDEVKEEESSSPKESAEVDKEVEGSLSEESKKDEVKEGETSSPKESAEVDKEVEGSLSEESKKDEVKEDESSSKENIGKGKRTSASTSDESKKGDKKKGGIDKTKNETEALKEPEKEDPTFEENDNSKENAFSYKNIIQMKKNDGDLVSFSLRRDTLDMLDAIYSGSNVRVSKAAILHNLVSAFLNENMETLREVASKKIKEKKDYLNLKS